MIIVCQDCRIRRSPRRIFLMKPTAAMSVMKLTVRLTSWIDERFESGYRTPSRLIILRYSSFKLIYMLAPDHRKQLQQTANDTFEAAVVSPEYEDVRLSHITSSFRELRLSQWDEGFLSSMDDSVAELNNEYHHVNLRLLWDVLLQPGITCLNSCCLNFEYSQ